MPAPCVLQHPLEPVALGERALFALVQPLDLEREIGLLRLEAVALVAEDVNLIAGLKKTGTLLKV